MIELSECCNIIQGGRLKLNGNHFLDEGYPAYGAGGLNGFLPQYEFDRAAVVLSSIGARCGKCFLADGKWTSLVNTQVLLPDLSKADPRFLWYQLNDEARWPRSGSAQPFIKPSDVKRHRIALPPLDEQRRIAAILDQADDLRRKRREAITEAEELLDATFRVGFLGNQANSWPTVSVGDVSRSVRTGPFGSQLLHSEFTQSGVAVLGIDNAVANEFQWAERRFISEAKYRQLSRYRVFPRDLLITIMATCGRAAIVPKDIPLAINTKHLCCLTLDEQRCLPEFLHAAVLRHPGLRHQLGAKERGAVMPGLNTGLIKDAKLPLPPLSLQLAFAARVAEIDKLKAQHRAHLARLDALFASLQHRAFRGEL